MHFLGKGKYFSINNHLDKVCYFLEVCVSEDKKCSFFWKIWLGLFSWNTRFEIRLFALLPTSSASTDEHSQVISCVNEKTGFPGRFKNTESCNIKFSKKFYHCLLKNLYSLLNKINDLRILIQDIRLDYLVLKEKKVDNIFLTAQFHIPGSKLRARRDRNKYGDGLIVLKRCHL